ncbi:MAG TPA: ATP-binding protein [Elusimicrobiota bacterium]|nr:ATP-binding protein [Elusimicrobiota bacterium]
MTLRAKLLAFVLPYAAVTVGLITVFGYFAARGILVSDVEAKSRAIVVGYDKFRTIVNGLRTRNPVMLRMPLTELTSGGALSAAALDPDGRVIAHSNRLEEGKTSSLPPFEQRRRREPIPERVTVSGRPAIRTTLPVWTEPGLNQPSVELGSIQVTLPLQATLVTAQRLSVELLGIILGVIAIATAFLFWGLRWLLRPVSELAELTARLSSGPFGQTIAVRSNDELGELARRFNELSRHLAETAISRDFFEAVIEEVLNGIIVTDAGGRITLANQVAADVLGRTPGELVGAPVRKFIVRRSLKGHGGPRRFSGEASLIGAAGTIPVLVGVSRLRYRGGQRSLIVSFRDISTLNRAKSDLADANRELEAFSYAAAHDLKTPLRTITNYSDLVLGQPAALGDPLMADRLGRIRSAGKRMAELIDALLLFSRVTRKEAARTSVSLSAIAREEAQKLAAADAGRAVKTDIEPALDDLGDEQLIRLLLRNLLSNAWKFTSRSRAPKVQFGREKVDGASAYYVRDNGVGFDPRYLSKILVPFERLHDPAEYPGSGVGLPLAERIVRKHGGSFWAQSRPNEGATFYFTLHRRLAAKERQMRQADPRDV